MKKLHIFVIVFYACFSKAMFHGKTPCELTVFLHTATAEVHEVQNPDELLEPLQTPIGLEVHFGSNTGTRENAVS
jgi:hypothetical protein